MQTGSRAAYIAEFLGTMAIVATVIGAGFMTSELGAEAPLGLAMIAASVGAVLFVAISTLAPVSGAHFNPAVTLAFLQRKEITARAAFWYLSLQSAGAVSGAIAANLMFEAEVFAVNSISRFTTGTGLGEVVATAGLVLLILLLIRNQKANLIAAAVAAWIFAGHLFTSSTSFANPAVTFGRVFSEAPSGISLESALWFALAQIVGLALALILFKAINTKEPS